MEFSQRRKVDEGDRRPSTNCSKEQGVFKAIEHLYLE